MKKTNLSLIIFALVAILSSCTQQETSDKPKEQIKFGKYISSHTMGHISSGAPVRVFLNTEIENRQLGTELGEGIFMLEPDVKGKLFLVNPHTIEFRPDRPLSSGKAYFGILKLDKLLETETGLGDFIFKFEVMKQDFTVLPGRCISTAKPDDYLKRYEGKIQTADAMGQGLVEKLLSVSSPMGKLNLEILPDGANGFKYIIDSIPRLDESYNVTLSWDGRDYDIDREGSLEFEIPSNDKFVLLDVDVNHGDEQFIRLSFSDPIDLSQDLKGLIHLKGIDHIRISSSGSTVTLYPGYRLTGEQVLVVEGQVKNSRGKKLEETKTIQLSMEALKPQVVILGNGNIIPGAEGLVLPFKAVGLRAVDVTVYKIFAGNIPQFFQRGDYNYSYNIRPVGRPVYRKMHRLDDAGGIALESWNAFSVDLNDLANEDLGAFYRVKVSFRKEYAVYTCKETATPDLSVFEDQDLTGNREMRFWDGENTYFNDWPEGYNWRDRDDPCTNSYYNNDRFPQRNLVSSNLGVIAKSSDNYNFTVAVTDLLSAKPVPGSKVEFYNFQQQPIASGETDGYGMLNIDLGDRPFLLKASHNGSRSWLRIDDGSSLSVSNFDVSGQEVQEGIKGMIYGERGVWRPGDTLFLTFVMDDINQKLPTGHPVVLELYNSRGQLAGRKVNPDGQDGFYKFTMTTDPEAPTGNWSAIVKVGGATFTKRLKIETIKPNRLRIKIDFNRELLCSNDKLQKGYLDVKWLHGADASKLRANVNLKLIKSVSNFKGFENYTFNDPSKQYWPVEKIIFDSRLSESGKADFPIFMRVNDNAPGMLKAVFNTRVFEEGGDFSTDYYSVPFAPYNEFVGLKVVDGGDYRNMLLTDTNHVINIASIDKNGNPVSMENIEVKVYKVGWRWWWSSSNDNLAAWMRGEEADLVMQKKVSTTNGKGNITFRVEYPEWGRYFVHVSDPSGGHSAGKTIYVDWPSYVNRRNRSNPTGATMLSFSADKETYNPGGLATINFPSAEGSRALVSIESGSEVLKNWWVECDAGETNFPFEITPDMAPNIYVNLTLLQPYSQTVNDLPIRMYGVIPLSVEDPKTILRPEIKLPDEIKPKSNYQLEVSEKDGRPMTYTIAVVDEGLLDITRFKTPDPWKTFFAREALGVKTWDMFDDVLGAFGGEIQKVLAIGGDEEALADKDKKANRFKPVVTWLGPFNLKKGKTASHELYMPNYVGSVRAMVVAGKDGAWGSADATCPVRQAVMVLPTAPRVLGPGEIMDLPVSVFAMKDNVSKVIIEIAVDGELEIIGNDKQALQFEKPGEEMVYFRLRAKEAVGIGKIVVTAKSGKEGASAEIELEVRNPNPMITKSETFVMEAGENRKINYVFHGIEGTNSGNIEISTLPSFDLERNISYLIRYPYGCVEQVTSSVFPQLYLGQFVDLSDGQLQRIDRNIRKAIQKLTRYQMSDGSLSYWPGRNYYSNWGTTYAGHFLLLAEQKGYLVPYDFKKKWLGQQSKMASDFNTGYYKWNHNYGDLMQSYRLYTLALAGQPNIGAMNRLREKTGLSIAARWRLAAAYVLAGKPEVAEKLTELSEIDKLINYEFPGPTYGSRLRDQAMILETLVLMDKMDEAYDLALVMIEQMKNRYMSTQTSAFCLYAMSRFAAASNASANLEFVCDYAGKTKSINSLSKAYQFQLDPENTSVSSFDIQNTSEGTLYITKTMMGQPLAGEEISESKNLEIEVKYMSLDGKRIKIDSLKQGYDFMVEVNITNPGVLGTYENMALSQVFPSGWEILNTRVNDQEPSKKESPFNYRDIRDDRVYTFFAIKPHKNATYRVMLNAAYTGKFYLPAVSCEAMYNNKIYAREEGRWVKVVK